MTSWTSPALERAERRLESRRALVLAVLLALSALVRVVYFVQLSAGPYVRQHLWDQSDMHFFDRWARALAAGDWLTSVPMRPNHGWQIEMARAQLAAEPSLVATLGSSPGVPPEQALLGRWLGGVSYYQEPLYPWLVALAYRATGADVRHMFAWQLAVGVLANGLVFLVGRRAFGALAGTVAGVLAWACGPLLYLEMQLLRDSLIVAATLGLVLLFLCAGRRGAAYGVALGAACGAAVLLKATFALWLAPSLAVLAIARRRQRHGLGRLALGVALGGALALAPLVVRNAAVGAPPLALSGAAAMNVAISCAEDVPGDVGLFVSRHAGPVLAATGGRLGATVVGTLRTHPGPGSVLRQLWRKLQGALHWYEIPDNANFYAYRQSAPVLALPVNFLAAAPLALVGLALALPRLRVAWPLYLAALGSLALLLVFFPVSRFRAPLLALLLPFAAYGLARVVDLVAARRLAAAGAAAGAAAVLGLWVGRPLPPGRSLLRAADCRVPMLVAYGPAYAAAAQRGDWQGAAAAALQAAALEPESVRRLGAEGAAVSGEEERGCAAAYADAYALVADALAQSGEPRGAAIARARAEELARVVAAGPKE